MSLLDSPRWAIGKTIIDDYHDIVELLKHPGVQALRGKEPVEGKILSEGVINTLDGDEHLRRRRHEGRLFTRDALAYFHRHALAQIVEDEFNLIHSTIESGETPRTDLSRMMLDLLHRVAASVAGIDGVNTPEQVARFNVLIDDMMGAFTLEIHRGEVAEVVARARAAKEEFRRDYLAASLARRRDLVEQVKSGELEADRLPRDVVTTMLINWENGWDDDLVLREAMSFANGSTRTSARSAVHIVHHLIEWTKTHPEDSGRLADTAFIQRAMFESLRLHPVVPALLRIAMTRITLSSGRVIEAGERLALLYGAASQDSDLFGQDAARFNPEREITKPNVQPWGLAFGAGAHLCIGRRMATGGGSFGARAGEATDSSGSLVYIITKLFEYGIRPDPDLAAELDEANAYYDAWRTYPVVFTLLPS